MKQTFSIGFICRNSKASKKTGLAPIELSIVINGERTYLVLQRKMKPEEFKKLYESKRDNTLKHYTSLIRQRIDSLADDLMQQDIPLTAKILKEYFKRGGVKEGYTIEQLFNDFLAIKAKEDITIPSYKRYERGRDYFLQLSGCKVNQQAKSVKTSDIALFKAEMNKRFGANYTATIIGKVKSAFQFAFESGKIPYTPFAGIKLERKRETDTVKYLTAEQLSAIRNLELDTPHIERVRNLFLFQCGCGLAVADLMKLVPDDFEIDAKTHSIYIKKKRQKTDIEFVSVLIGDAPSIIENWDFIVPKISPQKYNDYLKVIGGYIGVEKLTTHMARHTYATQLLNSGIPIEVVQKSLGHSSPYMTRIYAKLMDRTVIDNISRIKRNSNRNYTIVSTT